MDRKMVDFIKEQYPPGTRIWLNSMEDPYAPIAPGTEGEVDFVDDIGTIHMRWDNGRTLGIAPGEDSFTVLPPKLNSLKLYIGELGQRKNKDRSRIEAREKYAAAHRLVERCAAAIAVIILSVFPTPAVPAA